MRGAPIIASPPFPGPRGSRLRIQERPALPGVRATPLQDQRMDGSRRRSASARSVDPLRSMSSRVYTRPPASTHSLRSSADRAFRLATMRDPVSWMQKRSADLSLRASRACWWASSSGSTSWARAAGTPAAARANEADTASTQRSRAHLHLVAGATTRRRDGQSMPEQGPCGWFMFMLPGGDRPIRRHICHVSFGPMIDSRLFRLPALLLSAALLAACASAPPAPSSPSAQAEPYTLLLVSLDGVHPDDLTRGDTPHLERLAAQGVQAEGMVPSYPTLTFPNHYTLVTGLRPDRHGIVHNSMSDPGLGRFTLRDRDAVGDGRWWSDGEPLWVTAENEGIPTATLFWPGSEAPVRGVQPTRWTQFDSNLPKGERVDRVLSWLSEPDGTRPRLATLYFEHPDGAAHAHGAGSPELRAAMRADDAQIGRLVHGVVDDGLAARGDS